MDFGSDYVTKFLRSCGGIWYTRDLKCRHKNTHEAKGLQEMEEERRARLCIEQNGAHIEGPGNIYLSCTINDELNYSWEIEQICC